MYEKVQCEYAVYEMYKRLDSVEDKVSNLIFTIMNIDNNCNNFFRYLNLGVSTSALSLSTKSRGPNTRAYWSIAAM